MKVSIVVPAYNEQDSINRILTDLKKIKSVEEVVFVNDGSSDNTLKNAQKVKGVTIVDLPENHGKAFAIARGIEKAKGEIIVMFDSDLKGSSANIQKVVEGLVNPIKDDEFDMVLAYPKGYGADAFFKPLTGERAFKKKSVVHLLKNMESKGYGLELFINYNFRNKRIKSFAMEGVVHPRGKRKGYKEAVEMTVVEVKDILREIFQQDKPTEFFLRAYIYSFYLEEPNSKKEELNKLFNEVKDRISKMF